MKTFDPEQLRHFLSAILDPTIGCCELRVFHADYEQRTGFIIPAVQFSKTLAGWYSNANDLIADAHKLKGISGYVTVNPVKLDLLARCCNKIAKQKHTTTDADIVCLRWLYVDIDPVRPPDISSTEEELAKALARRDLILAEHPKIQKTALWGCSGNGAFILARLPDFPNDAKHRKIVGDGLDAMAADYSDDEVVVDTKTRNPSRVMAIPGVLKCKGSDVPTRRHRLTIVDGGLNGRLHL
jgi:hypothetical protein